LKPNIPIRRLVLELSVTCSNELCNEVIRKCEMEKHMLKCKFTLIPCENNPHLCEPVIRRDYAAHVNELCPYRTVFCLLLCGKKMALNMID
jgi:hypothetical protein